MTGATPLLRLLEWVESAPLARRTRMPAAVGIQVSGPRSRLSPRSWSAWGVSPAWAAYGRSWTVAGARRKARRRWEREARDV